MLHPISLCVCRVELLWLYSYLSLCWSDLSSYSRQPKLPTKLRWLLRSSFKVGPSSLSNFQSFPRVDPLLPRKELLLLSLYCLIQTASLFKNILGSLSKGGKNNKKKIIKKYLKILKIQHQVFGCLVNGRRYRDSYFIQ